MKIKINIELFILALLLTILIVCYFASFELTLIVIDFVSPLAPGLSFWKSLLLLIWVSAITWLVFFTLLFNVHPGNVLKHMHSLLFLIAFCQILNLAAHYIYVLKYNLNFSDYSIMADYGRFSSNNLTHTHVMKYVLAFIFDYFAISSDTFTDIGTPFKGVLPKTFLYISTVAISSVIYLLVTIIIKTAHLVPKNLLIIWLICVLPSSFAVLKSILDGGPLSPEFILGSLILFKALKTPASPVLDFYAALLLSIPIFILEAYLSAFYGINFITGQRVLHITALMVGLPYLLEWTKKKDPSSLIKSLVILSVTSPAFIGSITKGEFRSANYKIPAGTTVYFTEQRNLNYSYQEHLRDHNIKVYKLELENDTRMLDLYKLKKISPRYRSFLIDGRTCKAAARHYIAGKIYTEDKPPLGNNLGSDLIPEFQIEPCDAESACSYRYYGYMKGCILRVPESPVVVNRLFALGFQRFALQNMEH